MLHFTSGVFLLAYTWECACPEEGHVGLVKWELLKYFSLGVHWEDLGARNTLFIHTLFQLSEESIPLEDMALAYCTGWGSSWMTGPQSSWQLPLGDFSHTSVLACSGNRLFPDQLLFRMVPTTQQTEEGESRPWAGPLPVLMPVLPQPLTVSILFLLMSPWG